MKTRNRMTTLFLTSCLAAGALVPIVLAQTPLQRQNEQLFQDMKQQLSLTDEQLAKIRTIFARSGFMGQGNPAITRHPVTPEQCRAKLEEQAVTYANPTFEKICGAKFMAPLYDPATQKPEDAKICIDQFEAPDIPCSYPIVWVRAREAAEYCEAEGKRMCDAHEWEGACEGSLQPPDYPFDLAKGVSPNVAVARMQTAHNREYAPEKSWSYGPTFRQGSARPTAIRRQAAMAAQNAARTRTQPATSRPAIVRSMSMISTVTPPST
jgi:sulfatase-modifying factor enzyme 1